MKSVWKLRWTTSVDSLIKHWWIYQNEWMKKKNKLSLMTILAMIDFLFFRGIAYNVFSCILNYLSLLRAHLFHWKRRRGCLHFPFWLDKEREQLRFILYDDDVLLLSNKNRLNTSSGVRNNRISFFHQLWQSTGRWLIN